MRAATAGCAATVSRADRLIRPRRRPVSLACLVAAAGLAACLAWPVGADGATGTSQVGAPALRQVVATAAPDPLPVQPTATPLPTAPVVVEPELPEPSPTPTLSDLEMPPEPPFPYVERLIAEVNLVRTEAGLQSLLPAPPEANAGMEDYLSAITPTMLATGTCVNGAYLGVGSAWDYAAARGYMAEPLGELLTCAGPAYWSPRDNVNGWLASPALRPVLGDTTADTLACGGYGPQPDGRGFRSFVCVTYRAFL